MTFAPIARRVACAALALSAVLAVSSVRAADAAAAAPKSLPLLGAWQEGLDADFRALPPDRAKAARAKLGDVLVFRADGSMQIYPRCGADTKDLKAAGLAAIPASWLLLDDQTLIVSAEHGGKPIDHRTRFAIQGDQLAFLDNGRAQYFGRYIGSLPPACE